MRSTCSGICSSGCMAASMITCARTSPSCLASSLRAESVITKMTMFITIKARVMTGQRRAVMFSCLIGMSISSLFCYRLVWGNGFVSVRNKAEKARITEVISVASC